MLFVLPSCWFVTKFVPISQISQMLVQLSALAGFIGQMCQSVAAVAATCVHDILQSCPSRRIPCDTKVQAQKFQMLLGFLQMLLEAVDCSTTTKWDNIMLDQIHGSKFIMISTEIYSYLNSSAHLHNIWLCVQVRGACILSWRLVEIEEKMIEIVHGT